MKPESPDPIDLTIPTNHKKPKGLLYHYTTADGFLGMLESDSIRATHIRYMNDSKEFTEAIEHVGGLVDTLANEFIRYVSLGEKPPKSELSNQEDLPRASLEQLQSSVKAGLKEFLVSIDRIIDGRSGAYVVSFTDDASQRLTTVGGSGDRLSQWRAYGGGARGISLGFDHDAIHGEGPGQAWTLGGCTAYLLDCLYEEDRKRSALRSITETAIPTFRKMFESEKSSPGTGDNFELHLPAFRRQMILGWIINASTFKDPAFSEEKEWRVVILGHKLKSPQKDENGATLQLRFRNGPLGVTPYLEFPLHLASSASPLRRVVVGPTPHIKESVRAVEMALEERGIEIRSESCPTGI
jgi:hypothetical protein